MSVISLASILVLSGDLLIGSLLALLFFSGSIGTSAMDRNTEQFILNLLQQLKKERPILFVSHRMKVADFSDYIYILENGRITSNGEPKTLIKEENFFSESIYDLLL